MAYDPTNGKVEDFGIGPPYQGINTGSYDPKFNRICGMTHPRGEFAYYDVATRRSVNKGRVNNWESICRTLAIDDQGNVYGGFGAGQVFKYDPRTDEIRGLSVQTPVRPKGVSLGRDYNKSETAFRTAVWDAKSRKFYGSGGGAPDLVQPGKPPHAGLGRDAAGRRSARVGDQRGGHRAGRRHLLRGRQGRQHLLSSRPADLQAR
jgi:hypothetical protein